MAAIGTEIEKFGLPDLICLQARGLTGDKVVP